jgi:hypothetical protein
MNIWTHFAGLTFFLGITVYFFSGNPFLLHKTRMCCAIMPVFTAPFAGLFPSHASDALSSISKGSVPFTPSSHLRPPRHPSGLHRGIPTVPWRNWLVDLNGTSISSQLDHYMDFAKLNAKEVEARMHVLWDSLSALGVNSFPKFNLDNQRFSFPHFAHLLVCHIRSALDLSTPLHHF